MIRGADRRSSRLVGAKPVRDPLADRTIGALAPPPKGSCTRWEALPGFGCRVARAGSRAFVVPIAGGRTASLGRCPAVPLADTRREARRSRADQPWDRVCLVVTG